MTTRALASGLLTAILCACSGSDNGGAKQAEKPAETSGAPAPDPAETERQENLRKLRAAQDTAVEAMCERLVDCSVESLRNAPAEERAKAGNVDELIPKARAECEEEASKSDLSPRQVITVQKCVNEGQTCEELISCLDTAQKSAADSPAGSP
jgi:hypothetical protein